MDDVGIDQPVPEGLAGLEVGPALGERSAQHAGDLQEAGVLGAQLALQLLAQPHGQRRGPAAGGDGHRQVPPADDGRRDEVAVGDVVEGVDQDVAPPRLFPDPLRDRLRLGHDHHQEGGAEVPAPVAAGQGIDPPLDHEPAQGRRQVGGDHRHPGARGDQPLDLLLGHGAAADHEAGAVPEIEIDRVIQGIRSLHGRQTSRLSTVMP